MNPFNPDEKIMDSFEIKQMILAHTWRRRLKGLLGDPPLNATQALWLKPCNAIHTVGMTYPIAVHFLDSKGQVVRSIPSLRPWRFAICLRATSVIEMSSTCLSKPSDRVGAIQRYISTYFFNESL